MNFIHKCVKSFLKKQDSKSKWHKILAPSDEDEAVIRFVARLQPIHSCSVDALLSIIGDGFVSSRKDLKKRWRSAKKCSGLLSPKECAGIHKIVHKVSPHPEMTKGPTGEVFKSKALRNFVVLWEGKLKSHIRRTKKKGRRPLKLPLLCRIEIRFHEYLMGSSSSTLLRCFILEKAYVFSKTILKEIDKLVVRMAKEKKLAGGHGMNCWLDEYLGTADKIFTVLGPNVHYGQVSLVFNNSVLTQDKTLMGINSSISTVSGETCILRRWLAEEYVPGGNEWEMKAEHLYYNDGIENSSYDEGMSPEEVSLAELKANKRLWEKMTFSPTVNDLKQVRKLIAREISAQAKVALESTDYFHPYLLFDEAMDRESLKNHQPGRFRSGFRTVPLENITENEIVDWYLNVDINARIEVLLHNKVDIKDVDYILIPRALMTKELETQLKRKKLMGKVVVTKNKTQSRKLQVDLFKGGKIPTGSKHLRFAFLVGQNDGKLKCCVDDARKVGKILSEIGYECTILENVNYSDFRKGFMAFIQKIKEKYELGFASKCFFYFSGHGREENGKNMLCCMGNSFENMKLNFILKNLNKFKFNTNFVVIDACRSSDDDTFKKSGNLLAKPLTSQNMNYDSAFVIGMSCATGCLSFAGSKGNLSRYTKHLVSLLPKNQTEFHNVLKKTNKLMKLDSMARSSSEEKQVSWINSNCTEDVFI